MARIEIRDRDSNDGARRGLNGISIPPQKYVILYDTAAEAAEDPTVIFQNHADGVPLGAAYKFESFSAICTDYELGHPLGHVGHEIYAIFTPITVKNSGWRRSVRGYLDTQHILEEPIVAPGQSEQRIIGGNLYLPAPNPQAATHVAPGLTGTAETEIRLIQTTRRVKDGWDVPKPGFSIYYTRDDLPHDINILARAGVAGSFLGAVNSTTFDGEVSILGAVLFSELSIDELPGPAPGSAFDAGYHFGAQLKFDIRPDKFSPIRKFHTLEHDDGDVAFVRTLVNGQIVFEDFVVIRPDELNGVFPILSP